MKPASGQVKRVAGLQHNLADLSVAKLRPERPFGRVGPVETAMATARMPCRVEIHLITLKKKCMLENSAQKTINLTNTISIPGLDVK